MILNLSITNIVFFQNPLEHIWESLKRWERFLFRYAIETAKMTNFPKKKKFRFKV